MRNRLSAEEQRPGKLGRQSAADFPAPGIFDRSCDRKRDVSGQYKHPNKQGIAYSGLPVPYFCFFVNFCDEKMCAVFVANANLRLFSCHMQIFSQKFQFFQKIQKNHSSCKIANLGRFWCVIFTPQQ
jgi:hypothetical protein